MHCGETFDVDTATGPLPSACAVCDPETAARRVEVRGRSRRNAAARTAEVVTLRHRVDVLEQQLRTGLPARRDPHRPAGRDTVASAVRRVGTAEGRHETARRLHELAAEAEAWAAVIQVNRETDPADALQGRTA